MFGNICCLVVFTILVAKHDAWSIKVDKVQYLQTCGSEGQQQIRCDEGKIIIQTANFGRDSIYPCKPVSSGDPEALKTELLLIKKSYCQSPLGKQKLEQLCNGKSSCEYEATVSFFGDPCPDLKLIKYLNAEVGCL